MDGKKQLIKILLMTEERFKVFGIAVNTKQVLDAYGSEASIKLMMPGDNRGIIYDGQGEIK